MSKTCHDSLPPSGPHNQYPGRGFLPGWHGLPCIALNGIIKTNGATTAAEAMPVS